MYGTRDTAANFDAIVMDTLTNKKFAVGLYHPCLCRHATTELRRFHHDGNFAILADEENLQWLAKELNEALIIKVCGVLVEDERNLKEIKLLSCIVRHGQTASGWAFLEWEAG